jgi:hypothetical protein
MGWDFGNFDQWFVSEIWHLTKPPLLTWKLLPCTLFLTRCIYNANLPIVEHAWSSVTAQWSSDLMHVKVGLDSYIWANVQMLWCGSMSWICNVVQVIGKLEKGNFWLYVHTIEISLFTCLCQMLQSLIKSWILGLLFTHLQEDLTWCNFIYW